METMTHRYQWDAVAGQADGLSQMLEAANRKLLELGKLFPGAVVLDLGCGSGTLARMAAEQVGPTGRVVGVDASEAMIAKAEETHAGISNLAFHVHDAQVLNFPENACDVAFCQMALPFFAEPQRALERALAVLKPGGRLVVMNPGGAEHNDFFLKCNAAARDHFAAAIEGDRSPDLERLGFQDVRSRPIRALVEVTDPTSYWNVVRGALGIPEDQPLEGDAAPPYQRSLEIYFVLARKPDPNAAQSYDLETFDGVVAKARRSIRELAPHEVRRNLKKQDVCYLDVREPEEVAGETIKGSRHIPRGELEFRVQDELPDRATPIVTFCQDGSIGAMAARRLGDMGYGNVWNLTGGISAWRHDRMPMQKVR